MCSAFRLGQAADRVLFRGTKSRVPKWEVLARRKYTDYNSNRKKQVIGIFSSGKDFPIFWQVISFLWIILDRYHTVRVCWLPDGPESGPILNAENTEFLLLVYRNAKFLNFNCNLFLESFQQMNKKTKIFRLILLSSILMV